MSFFDPKGESSSSRPFPARQQAFDSTREFQPSNSSADHHRTFTTTTSNKRDAESEWSRFDEDSSLDVHSSGFFEFNDPYLPPLHTQPPDGTAVFDFLSHPTAYTNSVHSPSPSDLSSSRYSAPESVRSLVDPAPLNLANLLAVEDVGAYLARTTYTDDVYELPVFLQRMINEAREEVVGGEKDNEKIQHRALDRLNMMRKHLLVKVEGDIGMIPRNVGSVLSEEELEQVWGAMI
ncbi:hypothetical protein BC937DRAFT_89265 [Endogone sp. FLAS-F59071]|nr:hypothetical protein BC937DRAFT_89265 [Endogone sp. FLAS-F59071]|eukprot:RUS17986.1 hypothetical protein BC937DRAFT_89265 [Endogone sp. FLAS-F59071]